MIKKLLPLAITLLLSGNIHAAGDITAGKNKTAACAGCHGDKGNSLMPLFPKLAEQHSGYLKKQLAYFKDGTRNDPTMSALAQGLSDTDMADIAAYYAAQQISSNKPPVITADDEEEDETSGQKPLSLAALLQKGSNLYRNGNLKNEVSACIACHGPEGKGNKPAGFPMLKSQHADYLIKTLSDYKNGARNKNADNMMNMIASKMTAEEIKAVAYHISMMK